MEIAVGKDKELHYIRSSHYYFFKPCPCNIYIQHLKCSICMLTFRIWCIYRLVRLNENVALLGWQEDVDFLNSLLMKLPAFSDKQNLWIFTLLECILLQISWLDLKIMKETDTNLVILELHGWWPKLAEVSFNRSYSIVSYWVTISL